MNGDAFETVVAGVRLLERSPGFRAAWKIARPLGAVAACVFALGAAACQAEVAGEAPAPSPPRAVAPGEGTARSGVPSTAAPPEPPRLADVAKRARDAWLAAFTARDADRLAAVYAEDACVSSGGAPPVCGKGAIAEAARSAWAKLPAVKAAWGRAWVGGDAVAVESAWSADARGSVSFAISRFTPDGRIKDEVVYADARTVHQDDWRLDILARGQRECVDNVCGKPRIFEGLPITREAREATGAAEEAATLALARATFASPALADGAALVDLTESGTLLGSRSAPRWVGARAGGLGPGFRVAITGAWDVGGDVVVEYETSGRIRGATRRETLQLHGAEVLRFERGRLVRAWRYADPVELWRDPNVRPLLLLAVP